MRFDAARDFVSQARHWRRSTGLSGCGTPIRDLRRAVERLAGEAAAAESELRPACEGTERIGEFGFLSSLAPLLVEAVLMQGRDDEALLLTERWRPERLTLPEDADAHAGWRRVRAKVLARSGKVGEAERIGREAGNRVATELPGAHAMALADLGEVLRLGGHADGSAATSKRRSACTNGKATSPRREASALLPEAGNGILPDREGHEQQAVPAQLGGAMASARSDSAIPGGVAVDARGRVADRQVLAAVKGVGLVADLALPR